MARKDPAFVTVYCNLPWGVRFTLPNGRVRAFAGVPVSRFVGLNGEPLPAERYGITPHVPLDEWEWIRAAYADMALFKDAGDGPLLFAQADPDSGAAMARECGRARHGAEQADPKTGRTAPAREPAA